MIQIPNIKMARIIPVVRLLRNQFDLSAVDEPQEKPIADNSDNECTPLHVGTGGGITDEPPQMRRCGLPFHVRPPSSKNSR